MIPGNFVENFENKKRAHDEGLRRIDACNKYGTIGEATIYMVGGSIDEPVSSIRIEGTIEVKALPIFYGLLTGKKT